MPLSVKPLDHGIPQVVRLPEMAEINIDRPGYFVAYSTVPQVRVLAKIGHRCAARVYFAPFAWCLLAPYQPSSLRLCATADPHLCCDGRGRDMSKRLFGLGRHVCH